MAAAATLNSSIIAMPAATEGRAWVARVAARMSMQAPPNTSGRIQRSWRLASSRASDTAR